MGEAFNVDYTTAAQIAGVDQNFYTGFITLYIIIAILTVIVYKLGFARKLPLIKSVIVYIILLFGVIILTIFSIGLPIAEGLLASAVVLGIYRFRLSQSKKEQKNVGVSQK